MLCLVYKRRRIRNCLVRRPQKLNFITIKSSSIMFCRMDKEHTVHGIEHDERHHFLNILPINIRLKTGSSRRKDYLKGLRRRSSLELTSKPLKTDRQTNKKSYLHYFQDLIKDELWEFVQEAQVTCSMTDVWTVRYQKGDHQTIHNHKSWGFTGILYVEYDPKVHTPTCFVAPWQDPRSDTTSLAYPQNVKEGTIFISPSYTLHFVHPNQVRKHRTIISFDLLPKLPDHQSVS